MVGSSVFQIYYAKSCSPLKPVRICEEDRAHQSSSKSFLRQVIPVALSSPAAVRGAAPSLTWPGTGPLASVTLDHSPHQLGISSGELLASVRPAGRFFLSDPSHTRIQCFSLVFLKKTSEPSLWLLRFWGLGCLAKEKFLRCVFHRWIPPLCSNPAHAAWVISGPMGLLCLIFLM